MGDWGGGISVLDWLGASLVAAGEAGATESLGGSASVGLLCGWKKPFSDCWPLETLVVVAGALDLPLLIGFLGDADAEARRFSADLSGLWLDMGLPLTDEDMSAIEAAIASSRSLSDSSTVVLVNDVTSVFGGLSLSTAVGVGAGVDFGKAGFLLNMSRIFLLFVNSASSFPLRGGTSLTVSYSRCRTPSLNMPAGFIKSKI